jgi:hypothetical protein
MPIAKSVRGVQVLHIAPDERKVNEYAAETASEIEKAGRGCHCENAVRSAMRMAVQNAQTYSFPR